MIDLTAEALCDLAEVLTLERGGGAGIGPAGAASSTPVKAAVRKATAMIATIRMTMN
jgi:hypothetical protein